jgi:hypothetical protein
MITNINRRKDMFTQTRIQMILNPIHLGDRPKSLDLKRYMKKMKNTKGTGYLTHSSI